VLGRATGYIGLTNTEGSRFTAASESLSPILDALKKRGLLFIEGNADKSVAGALSVAIGLPRVPSDRILDDETTRDAIDRRLAELEQTARHNGAALGLGFAYPVTLERVALWAKTLEEKGIALMPVSALAAQRGERKGAAK
jgi:hypothetical protein